MLTDNVGILEESFSHLALYARVHINIYICACIYIQIYGKNHSSRTDSATIHKYITAKGREHAFALRSGCSSIDACLSRLD